MAVLTFVTCNDTLDLPIEVITVNLDKLKPIDLSNGKLIELETTDLSLLYDIIGISFIKDKLFIRTRNKIVVFDNNGKFLFNLGKEGKGPGEYTQVASVFVHKGNICIFDSMINNVLVFNDNGEYISSVKINPGQYALSDIYPRSDGSFICKNMFRGEQIKTPLGSLLNENYNFISTIEGRMVLTGFSTYNNFCQYNNEVLYYEPLCDTIFSLLDNQIVKPKYVVDFGGYTIPASVRKGKDVYDLIDYVNKTENKIASFVQHVAENDSYVSFKFIFDNKTPFVLYNKKDKSTNGYYFEDNSNKYIPQLFVCCHEKQVYLSVIEENAIERNPCLVVFKDDIFKN